MKLFIPSLVLLSACLGLVSPEVTMVCGDCPPLWFSFRNRCYRYVSTPMTWADAELHCVSQKANLVSIHSQAENNFVQSLIQIFNHQQGLTWIGLSDAQKEGGWMWSDGCPVNFLYWARGQPDNAGGNENCGETNWGTERKWNERGCSAVHPFVCATRLSACPS